MISGSFHFLKLERAVFYAMATRSLGIIAGPVTVLIITSSFTLELQGYYFTFASILALQTLLEMGLGTAIQQIASHEWARLAFDSKGAFQGDARAFSRLATLLRFALKWYAVAGLAAVAGLGAGGYFFFSGSSQGVHIAWLWPWMTVALFTGVNLFFLPGFSLLEGCNQVSQVYGFKLLLGLFYRIVLWAAMLAGGGLWAVTAERGLMMVMTALFFLFRYGRFFRDLIRSGDSYRMFWRDEIWPLQWRFALVWITGYFVFSLFVPVLFKFQGPVAAGRIGMTWALIAAIMALSHAVIAARMPRFAILAAKKAYIELDRLFFQSLWACVLVMFSGALIVAGAIYLLTGMAHPLADRFLPLPPTVLFLLATLFHQVRHAMGSYLRAHKREPYLVISIIEAGLILAVLFPLGKWFGAMGMAAGFLSVTSVMFVPALIIFQRCRVRWHYEKSSE